MLLNYKRQYNGNNFQRQCVKTDGEQDGDVQTEMSFLQNQTVISSIDGITHERVKCFPCNRKGYYTNECPDDTEVEQGVQMLHCNDEECTDEEEYDSHFVFVQKDPRYNSHIPSTWILLDSCSTISIFKTKTHVSNVRKGERTLVAITNGGQQISRHVVDTKVFGQVWFNHKSIANIFSLVNVVKYARVTMDSSDKNSIFVHREDGMVMEFKQYKSG